MAQDEIMLTEQELLRAVNCCPRAAELARIIYKVNNEYKPIKYTYDGKREQPDYRQHIQSTRRRINNKMLRACNTPLRCRSKHTYWDIRTQIIDVTDDGIHVIKLTDHSSARKTTKLAEFIYIIPLPQHLSAIDSLSVYTAVTLALYMRNKELELGFVVQPLKIRMIRL